MAGFVVAVAFALFLLVVVGLGVVSFAVRREERRFTLVGDAPDWLTRRARRLNGVGRREIDPRFFRSAREVVH